MPSLCQASALIVMQECEAVLDVLRQQEQDHLASVPPSQRHRIKQVQVCIVFITNVCVLASLSSRAECQHGLAY